MTEEFREISQTAPCWEVIGACSICGGNVVVPFAYSSIVPPIPSCSSCGATKADDRKIIEMTPRRGENYKTLKERMSIGYTVVNGEIRDNKEHYLREKEYVRRMIKLIEENAPKEDRGVFMSILYDTYPHHFVGSKIKINWL